jgi:hypothetical protein
VEVPYAAVVTLSVSKRRLTQFGKTLAVTDPADLSVADTELYEEFLQHYSEVRSRVLETVTSTPLWAVENPGFLWVAVGRDKSIETLQDKLRQGKELSTIQNVAGVRIVASCSLAEQNEICDRLADVFEGAKRTNRDRGWSRFGNRQVTEIIRREAAMTEILIEFNRTTRQCAWQEFSGEGARRNVVLARISAERKHSREPEMEIVVLSATSLEDARNTHARYFQTVTEAAV